MLISFVIIRKLEIESPQTSELDHHLPRVDGSSGELSSGDGNPLKGCVGLRESSQNVKFHLDNSHR